MKLAIVYFSRTGKTKAYAQAVAAGAEKIAGTEARCFPLEEIDREFLAESNAVVFGAPTYYANTCWQMKRWFDESKEFSLSGKLGGAFVTADYVQGGGDVGLLTLLQHMLVKGMVVYSGGSSQGQPFLHLGPVLVKGREEENRKHCEVFGERMARKAGELFP